jgi:hypothetical protein
MAATTHTADFSAAPQFNFSNASRNSIRCALCRDLDLALVKHTALSEKTDLEVCADVFDATNTPAFAQPNGSVGSAAFGTITATTPEATSHRSPSARYPFALRSSAYKVRLRGGYYSTVFK